MSVKEEYLRKIYNRMFIQYGEAIKASKQK